MQILALALTVLLQTTGSSTAPAQADLDARLRAKGLVDVQTLDPTIRVELKYATTDNFMHANVYGSLAHCFLQAEIAQKLVAAQRALRAKRPELGLLVYDCTRPHSVQLKMWELVRGTAQQRYVASPKNGSVHNYGAAVDLTIANADDEPLDMGTAYDFFGELAEPRHEARLLAEGKLSKTQLENRAVLRTVMTTAGFRTIPNEWWHFEAFRRAEVKKRFSIVE